MVLPKLGNTKWSQNSFSVGRNTKLQAKYKDRLSAYSNALAVNLLYIQNDFITLKKFIRNKFIIKKTYVF